MLYLLDANTLNYAVKRIQPVVARLKAATQTGATFVLSPVVHYEVTRYLKLKDARRLFRDYNALVADWERHGLDEADWETASDLWARRHRGGAPITDADLLIAVSALKTGAILVTNNAGHFQDLGLALENWAAAP